ncbi:MAG: hypothetical protein WAP36_00885 [Halanaerobiales bacterium]
MIKVYFSPQRADNQIEYSFCGEMVTARIGDAEDTFDFTDLPDGELHMEEPIETTLPVCPIISAKRIDGILHLELLNWIGKDAPYESRFPEWVELPLPKGAVKKEESAHKAVIPWRTKQEIEAERAVRLAAEQERQERRARIKEGLTTAKTEAELRSILQDMAREMGII